MLTTVDAYKRELKKLLLERGKNITENVVGGLAITTMEQYREHVGRLAEHKEFLELMDEADKALRER